MEIKLFLADEAATLDVGKKLSAIIPDHFMLYLQGNLGAGKTTFVRGFLRGFNFKGNVKSPTYTFIEPYTIENTSIFHMDFYRLEESIQIDELGFRDYFNSGICLIEWPERGESYLPKPDILCKIDLKDEGREIVLISFTSRGEGVLKKLEQNV